MLVKGATGVIAIYTKIHNNVIWKVHWHDPMGNFKYQDRKKIISSFTIA